MNKIASILLKLIRPFSNKRFWCFAVCILMLAVLVWAATPAGVTISNQAVISARNRMYVRTSNIVTTVVSVIHGLDINTNDPQTVLPLEAVYFPKTLLNVGNINESVGISVSYPVTWNVRLFIDDNQDGVYQYSESTLVPPVVNMSPTSSYKFFVAVEGPDEENAVGIINVSASISSVSIGKYSGFNNVIYGGPAVVSAAHTVIVASNTGDKQGPVVSDLKFDDILVVNGDYIGTTPVISAKVMDADGVVTTSMKINIDGQLVSGSIAFNGDDMSYHVTGPLGIGSHTFVFEVKDIYGNTSLRTFIGEITNKIAIVGRTLPYPNPYDPSKGPLKITYQLTRDTSLKLIMYSMTGERVWQASINSGKEGAHRGYNEVLWDGLTGVGTGVGNGVYLVYIVSDKGKVLSKTKVAVIR